MPQYTINDNGIRIRSRKWDNSEKGKAWQREYNKTRGLELRIRNRQTDRLRLKRYKDKLREEVITGLGGVCGGCGIKDYRVLAIDHINDQGYDRTENGRRISGADFYLQIKRGGCDRTLYQVLCYNCNYLKELERRKRNSKWFNGGDIEAILNKLDLRKQKSEELKRLRLRDQMNEYAIDLAEPGAI